MYYYFFFIKKLFSDIYRLGNKKVCFARNGQNLKAVPKPLGLIRTVHTNIVDVTNNGQKYDSGNKRIRQIGTEVI